MTSRWSWRAGWTWCVWSAAVVAARADVTGVVIDQSSLQPIAGALVSQQASGVRVVTAADGTFSLPADDGADRVIVAAKKGYYNGSIVVDGPAAGAIIPLEAVPQTDNPGYPLQSPYACGNCHPDQVDQWFNTPMANAGLNTWVHDTYSGTGSPGGMGGFVYVLDSVLAPENPASECAACHQPERWLGNPFSAMEGPLEPGYPSNAAAHGISCDVCHKIADVNVENINYPGLFPGFGSFTRPDGPPFEQVQYGVLADTDFYAPVNMRPSYQPQLVAEVCAVCHQDSNDLHGKHTFNGVISEPTYVEWKESPYSNPASPQFATCVDCHMPPSGQTEICTMLYPPLHRDPQTVRSHDIRGTTPEFLENAVELGITAQQSGAELVVDVAITNNGTGHHVPTGVTIRNMVLLVEAWRSSDDQPLVYTGTQTVHQLGGVGDPAQGQYAGLPGKFFAKVNHDATGNGPTFFTDAVGITFDNRIPALATDTSQYRFAVPPEGGEVRVQARLIYRRSFPFLTAAKGWTQDGHGNPLEDVLPPHFGHLMESEEAFLQLTPIDPQAIPTVSGWGMIAMAGILVTCAARIARRSPGAA